MQNLWIKYRDAKCNFFYHKESGSGGQNDAMDCYIDMTQQRADELRGHSSKVSCRPTYVSILTSSKLMNIRSVK